MGDRLTQVAIDGTSDRTIRYQYDGAGNRVRAILGNDTRQFLVAPSMGSGLQSTDLIADGNGNLLSNYVYAGGHTPFMRIHANGNPIYYLTDVMGTVIRLADGTGQELGDFGYDSFGNLRSLTGTPDIIDPLGGDFCFQMQWLKSDTAPSPPLTNVAGTGNPRSLAPRSLVFPLSSYRSCHSGRHGFSSCSICQPITMPIALSDNRRSYN